MSAPSSAYAGLGLSPTARRAASALVVVFALVAGALGFAAPAHAAGEEIRGTLTGPGGAPAAGVAVTVLGSGRSTVLTDATGGFSVPVPFATAYTVCWGPDNGTQPGDRRYLSGCSNRPTVVPSGGTATFDKQIRLGGVLTGRVTGTGTGALDGVRVEIDRRTGGGADDFRYAATTLTASDGSYAITLPPATYRIEFTDRGGRGFAREYYEDAATPGAAADVPVGQGDTVTADAELARANGITGTVTASADGYVNRTRAVAIIDATGKVVRRASLQRDGRYGVWGLAAGTYKVAFNRLSGVAYDAAEFYKDKAESAGLTGATPVNVTATSVVKDVDATLPEGGRIVGSIVDETGSALKGCVVQAYTLDGRLVTRTGSTNRRGEFTVGGLSSGSYYVRVLSPRRTKADCDGGRQWLTGSGGELAQAFSGATAVTVTRGTTKTLATPLVYTRGGSITGTVTLPADVFGIDRAVVVRNKATDKVAGVARVRDDGTYSVGGLADGSYRVTFARVSGIALTEAEFYDNKFESRGSASAADVVVTDRGETTRVDATLVEGGSISGKLAQQTGAPLAGCYVQAYDPTGNRVTRAAYTGTDGTFVVGGLTTGDYRLRVIGKRSRGYECRGATQFYAGPRPLDADEAVATTIRTLRGERTAVPGSLIFATGASLSGVVTRPAGSGRLDRTVVVRNTETDRARRVKVAADGSWFVGGLAAGAYRVTFNRLSGQAFAAAQFFDRQSESEGVDSATAVTLDPGESVGDVDATLVEGGHITGALVDTRGDGLDCEVQAYDPTGARVTRSTYSRGYTGGTFDIGGLTTGQYRLRVTGGGFSCFSGVQFLTTASGGALATTEASAVSLNVVQGRTRAVASPLVYGDAPLPAIANRTAPTVSGSPQVGSTLTASGGTWRPGTVALAYQWYAGAAAIGGATGRSYVPTASTVGAPVSVRVTASRDGYTSTTVGSAATAAVTGAAQPPGTGGPAQPSSAAGPLTFSVGEKPAVKGKAVVGAKLKADAGSTTPGAGTVSYQWLLNGKAIKGATKSSFKLKAALAGKKVSLRVTYATSGYTDLVLTTKALKVKAKKKKK